MLIDAYPWYPEVDCIIPRIKETLLKKGNGLAEYNLEHIYSVYNIEPEITGVALMATSKESMAFLRNEFGSEKMCFRFVLLGMSELEVDSVECDLPLAKHHRENRVIVSNKTGKKCRTSFNLLAKAGSLQLWEARTNFFRMHQVRVHAMESGISIVGEEEYAESRSPRSPAYKKGLLKKLGNPDLISEGLCLHLSAVEYEKEGKKVVVNSALPGNLSFG